MPLIYQAKCSACDYVSPSQSDGYLAVIVEEPCPSWCAHPDDSRLAVLAHPCEGFVLEEIGFTLASASLGGRMVDVNNVSCCDCGTMYELRRVGTGRSAFGGIGCVGILVLSAVIGLAVGRHYVSVPLGVVTAYLVTFGLLALGDAIVSLLIRRRYPDRVKEFDRGPDCPKCHSREYVRFPPFWKKLICPNCDRQTVRVRTIGIS